MSKQRDRDEFISIMAQEHVPVDVARALLRAGASLHRLSEWECNGYGWEDHWKRRPCPNAADLGSTDCDLCGRVAANPGATHYEVTRGTLHLIRETKRLEALVRRHCAKHGLEPVFGGDPRGAVLLVKVPSGRTNDWGQRGVVVA
jgi:hypothetical protein